MRFRKAMIYFLFEKSVDAKKNLRKPRLPKGFHIYFFLQNWYKTNQNVSIFSFDSFANLEIISFAQD